MDAEPRRWAATYTKHLKQKRKAYHDGALLLHPDSGRLVLLDDAGDTLECRFLRASEEVSAGAALPFHSYLVDVGQPEACPAGPRSRSPSSSSAAASRTAHRGGARTRPPSAAGRLNPRVPRAFVNPSNSRGTGGAREGEAAGSGGADEGGSRFQEWTVLYTAQLTQKAKKYHDGVLRLVKAGPLVKQIVLMDGDDQVLGSRHLKSGETIESGKKCIFPNYLIEICEEKNDNEGIHALKESFVQTGTNSGGNTRDKVGLSSVSKSQKFTSPQNFHVLETKSAVTASSRNPETGKPEMAASGSSGSFMGKDSTFKEWNALYTTQLTQKAKKYHDGVLRLVVGSHARQIVLLDEDGETLGSRYLKSVESVESGTTCQMPNYLIEVSDLRNQKNEGEQSLEEVSQNGQKSEENTSDKTDAKTKSPKFVSPFKFQDARKRNCESTASFNKPLVGKTTCNNMNSHDIQRATSTNSVWSDVGKSQSSNVGNPLKFHDLQDGISGCPTNFIRKEVSKSTFGQVDDSIRTASQILSIMKPPSGIKLPQDAPSGPARSLVPSDRMAHFATVLRTSVQSCLSLETPQRKNSLMPNQWNESFRKLSSKLSSKSGRHNNSCKNSTSMMFRRRPAAFENQDLAMIDILESEISSAKELRADSGNHHMGSSNDSVPSCPGLPNDKSETADQLSTRSSIVHGKCDGPQSTSAYTLTCKDPKIQELIDDCPSFDLGF